MNRFQLAKLVDWAGKLESRKRMQKVVFMLQAAKCPLNVDFYLHRYGPYSSEVAGLTDQLVRDGILQETEIPDSNGNYKYAYQLTSHGKSAIENAVSSPSFSDQLSSFESLAKSLLGEPLRVIEVASTIVFYKRAALDWETAKNKAYLFKAVDADSTEASKAEDLARRVLAWTPV